MSAPPDPTMSAMPSASASSAPPPTGEEVYMNAGCAACHGADGQGTTLGPELQHPDRDHFTWIVRNGVNTPKLEEFKNSVMIAYGTQVLTDNELDLVVEWLQSLPQPTTGAALFADYCAGCHGDDGRGGLKISDGPPVTLAAYVKNSILLPDIATNDPNTFDMFIRQGYEVDTNNVVVQISDRRRYMNAFPANPSNGEPHLTDGEMDLIRTWVAGQ